MGEGGERTFHATSIIAIIRSPAPAREYGLGYPLAGGRAGRVPLGRPSAPAVPLQQRCGAARLAGRFSRYLLRRPAVDLVLTIFRQPDGLTALLSHPTAALDLTDDRLTADAIDQAAAPCLLRVVPLASVSKQLVPQRDRLLAAWQALAQVTTFDATTLAAVLVILAETVPATMPASGSLPRLPQPPPTVRRATAAHPRAFRGTIAQPPAPPAPPAVDLRRYLCSPDGPQRVLARLAPAWPAACAALARSGYDTRAFAGRSPLAITGDSFVALRHADRAADDDHQRLPPRFLIHLLPALRGLPWTAVRSALGLYWALDLEKHPDLLASVAHLLRRQPSLATLAWCAHLAHQPAEARPVFAALMVATGAETLDPTALTPAHLDAAHTVTTPAQYAERLVSLFVALQRGLDLDYLLAGFRLASRFPSASRLLPVTASGSFPEATVECLLDHVRQAERWYPGLALTLWRRCGQLEGLAEVLTTTDWTALAPDVALDLLALYLDQVHHDRSPAQQAAAWHLLRRQARAINDLLRAVPLAYQAKAVAQLADFVWAWEGPVQLRRFLPLALALVRRLAQAPFRRQSEITAVLTGLIEAADAPSAARLLAAPDRVFRQLEATGRRRNDSDLIARGIRAMSAYLGAVAVQDLLEAPRQYCQVTKTMGSLSPQLAATVAQAVAAEPGGKEQPATARLARLEERSLALLAKGITNRIDRAAVKHALQLRFVAEENRRAFRRFLQAHLRGETDYRRQHPRTQAWLQRHPTLAIERWLDGLTIVTETAGTGPLHLAIEHDPLEALQLGTYVGSCLGLGGAFAYAAAAVVLDLNKQVVYARNGRGAVVARQLLAIAETECLVCFDIYPASAALTLAACFRSFDLAVSQAVGLPLYAGPPEEAPPIAPILSQAWWNDGAWDGLVDTEERRPSGVGHGHADQPTTT